jgi:hypothetical protein
LETIFFTNTGESILKAVFDSQGELVPFSQVKEVKVYKNAILSTICGSQTYELGANQYAEYQMYKMTSKTLQDDSSIRFVVEGTTHNLYEVRFHRINHRGDMSMTSF